MTHLEEKAFAKTSSETKQWLDMHRRRFNGRISEMRILDAERTTWWKLMQDKGIVPKER